MSSVLTDLNVGSCTDHAADTAEDLENWFDTAVEQEKLRAGM